MPQGWCEGPYRRAGREKPSVSLSLYIIIKTNSAWCLTAASWKGSCHHMFTCESSCVRDKPHLLYTWLASERRGFKSVKRLGDYWGNPQGSSAPPLQEHVLWRASLVALRALGCSPSALQHHDGVSWSNSIEALIDFCLSHICGAGLAYKLCECDITVWQCDSNTPKLIC